MANQGGPWLPRSVRVDGSGDGTRVPGTRYHGCVLALYELRAPPVRSAWARAPQKGRENGGKVVRERGTMMEFSIVTIQYYYEILAE